MIMQAEVLIFTHNSFECSGGDVNSHLLTFQPKVINQGFFIGR